MNTTMSILLVEDDKTTALKEQRFLEKSGFHVLHAANGEDALHTAFNDPSVVLILMDIDLGDGIDGIETARRITETRPLPIVYLTNQEDEKVIARARETSPCGYLLKKVNPITKRELITGILRHAHPIPSAPSSFNFEKIFMQHSIPMLLINVDTKTIDRVNPAALNFYGYSQNEFSGMSIHNLNRMPEEEISHYFYMAQTLEKNHFVFKHTLSDGTAKDVEIHSSPIELDTGHYLFSIVHDLTEETRLASEVTAQKNKLEQIISATRVGTWEWNVDTGETRFNNRWAEMFGYTLRELTPLSISTWQQLAHPEDLKESETQLKKHFKGESPVYEAEVRVRHKDGHWLWILDRGQVVEWNEDGSPHMMYGTHSDITEQKKREEKLRQQDEDMRTILNNLKNTVVEYIDRDMNLLWASDSISDYLAGSMEDCIGTPCHWAIQRSNTPCKNCTSVKAIESGNIEEAKVSSEDGRVWNVRSVPIKDSEGTVQRVVHFGFDITDQVRNEEEIIRARDIANEANKAKSNYLASMSHDIRTPLNGILGLTDLAMMTDEPEELYDYLFSIKESGNHLLAIVNDILDISKIESGNFNINLQPLALYELIRNIFRLFHSIITSRGIDFQLHIDDTVPEFVMGDETRLSQILHNLLSNAQKFTENGTIQLRLEKPSAEKPKDPKKPSSVQTLRLTVADTGPGIPFEKQGVIFEQYRQADDLQTTMKYGGTGLGLSICRQLTELMGGKVYLDSSPGKGSSFYVDIPFQIIRQSDFEGITHVSPLPLKLYEERKIEPLTILLAEDNDINIKLATAILGKYGHSVVVTKDGIEALDALRRPAHIFDLILMDIEMPLMDGLEATREIRNGACGRPHKKIPIIGMSAHALSEMQQKAMDAGMNGYVVKPIRIEKLEQTIRGILAESENESTLSDTAE